MAILAAEAGKHMHIEKPLGLSLGEEIALGNALQQHKFLFGTESRGKPHGHKFVELAANGFVGEIEEMYVIVGQGGGKIGAMPEEPVPEGFDWDLWLGPAPAAPHNRLRWNDYRFQLGDYCHGMFQNWGIHPLNIQQWWADLTGLGAPVHYDGEIKFHPNPLCGQVTVADTQLRYRNGQVLNLLTGGVAKAKNISCLNEFNHFFASVVLKGEKGWIGWSGSPATIESSLADYATLMRTPIENPKIAVPTPRGGFNNDLVARIKEGGEGIADWPSTFNSDTIFLLSILLGKVGASFDWDPDKREVVNCEAAKQWLRREMREPWGSAVYKHLPAA